MGCLQPIIPEPNGKLLLLSHKVRLGRITHYDDTHLTGVVISETGC